MGATVTASFLDTLDAEARSLLLSVATPVAGPAGTLLVRHGEVARGAFVLESGRVEVVVTLPGGETLTVATLGAGAMFGEMALVELGTCTATVRACEPVRGWFVAHEDFRALAAHCAPAAQRLQHAITLILLEKLAALNGKLLACAAPEDRAARRASPSDDPLAKTPHVRTPSFDARAFLPRLPLFQRFTDAEIDELLALGRYVEPPRGHAIFFAGAEPVSMFAVVRGALEIVAARDAMERRLALLGPGQLAGYAGVLLGRPRANHVFARETSVLLEIPAAAFRDAYFGDSRLSARLRHAVQESLLASLGRTNRALTRLISQAQLDESRPAERALEAAYLGQGVVPAG
jgi:CRP-like cAMP-binding protein